MSNDHLIKIFEERFGKSKNTDGDEVRFNCFFTDCLGQNGNKDSKYRLYVNFEKDKYFCQRCRRGGSVQKLLSYYGVKYDITPVSQFKDILTNYAFGITDKVNKDDELAGMPDNCEQLSPNMKAYQYLLSRGMTPDLIKYYSVMLGTEDLFDRVVFLDLDEFENVVYWVARTYTGRIPKYKNAMVSRRKKIFNLGKIRKHKMFNQVVITEGPLSAIIAGKNAVATYGKHITKQQFSILVRDPFEEYVVAYDSDALVETHDLAARLYAAGKRVKVILFEDGVDPADMGNIEFRKKVDATRYWSGSWNIIENFAIGV